MNDTPETDGEWNRLACLDHPEFEKRLADFARKLERERDDAIQEATNAVNDIIAVRWQRDRYRAALERIANADYRGNRSHESTIAHNALNP